MEYISLPRKKIPALAGFEPLPVEANISIAHTLPSELASPGKNSTKQLLGVVFYKKRIEDDHKTKISNNSTRKTKPKN